MEAAPTSSTGSPMAPYSHLGERAVRFIRDRGGSVSEDALIAFVFGTSGPPSLWQPLLQTLLTGEDRLVLRPDGRWSLAAAIVPSSQDMLSDFVAIDVETTGLQPLQQRVIEIALVRFSNGAPSDRYSTLINPEKRIPKFISNLTTITNDMVEDAPRFAEIAVAVEEFVAGALLVGHNVGFDINFVNAELDRAGRPKLINERLDSMGLASRLVPGLRRPSLDKVAAHFGLSPRKIHRAEIDAELSGKVALHLAVKARDLGIDTIERLRAIGRATDHVTASPVSRASSLLDRSILAEIPKRPGVYLMRDPSDRVIYVGKAKNLKERVSSYFSQPLGYTRKMDGLIESIARIEIEETGSELAALLLESQLIRRYQPRYNVAMRASEEYPYIRVDVASAWPRITLAKARKEDGSVYFGPFKSRKAAKLAIALVVDSFSIRTCTRSFKNAKSYGNPCIQLGIGKCSGPCTGRAERDGYMRQVRDAIAFLEGDDDALFTRLHEQLEASARTLDYERARKLRNNIRLLQTLVSSHRRLKEARENNTLLLVQPGLNQGSRTVMLVIQGTLWTSLCVPQDSVPASLAQQLAASWQRYVTNGLPPLDHHLLDDVVILNRWIARMEGAPSIIPIRDTTSIDWSSLAVRALKLTSKALTEVPSQVPSDEDLLLESITSEVEPKHIELMPADYLLSESTPSRALS